MGGTSSKTSGLFSFGAPAPPPLPPLPSQPSGQIVYSIPPNSGTVDIDVPNLQRCILQGGGSPCINYYVQGYDTSTNTFTLPQVAPQGFEQLEGMIDITSSNIVMIIIVLLSLIIAIKY